MRQRYGWLMPLPSMRALCWMLAIGVAWSLVAAVSASAQEARDDFWVTDGKVYAAALSPSSDVLYIGGDFTRVGPATGSGVAIDATTGLPSGSIAKVAGGNVNAVVPDGQGGWFIGGRARNCIAQMDAVTGAATVFDPRPNTVVRALALSDSAVYAGGGFMFMGSEWLVKTVAVV